MLPNAEDLAYGYWPEILSAAGVDGAFLTGRSGPCPFCGGCDRYQFQNRNGGRYVCRHCTEGKYRSGFDFLMRHMGLRTFREAADYVRNHFNVSPNAAPGPVVDRRHPGVRDTRSEMTPERIERNREKMQAVWDNAHSVAPDDPVDRYLRGRLPGLEQIPTEIRFHPALPYWEAPRSLDGRPVLIGNFPAMLVRGFDPSGSLVQIHKTFLTADGKKADVPHPKKTDVGVGSNSFAFRIGGDPQTDTLGVSEGIETALAAMTLRPGVPVWPCHSASVMANFVVPEMYRSVIKRVVIYADTDRLKDGRRAGQEAAAKLADSLRKQGVKSLIVRPAKVGYDMADLAAHA